DAYLDRIHLRVQRGNRRPCDALLPSPPFWWGATPSEATNGPPSVSLAVRHAFGRSQFGIPHPVRPATMIRYLFLVLTLLPLSAMQRSPVVSSSDEPERFEKIGDGRWFIDFGKAAFGNVEIRIPDVRAGTKLT